MTAGDDTLHFYLLYIFIFFFSFARLNPLLGHTQKEKEREGIFFFFFKRDPGKEQTINDQGGRTRSSLVTTPTFILFLFFFTLLSSHTLGNFTFTLRHSRFLLLSCFKKKKGSGKEPK